MSGWIGWFGVGLNDWMVGWLVFVVRGMKLINKRHNVEYGWKI
jgi:hypothetical protein